MAETDHIKPTSQGWPVTRSEGVSDPFEQIELIKSSPAQVPEKNAEPLTTDRRPDEVILPDTPGQEKRASEAPEQSYVPSQQPVRLSPRPSPDLEVPPSPGEKENQITEQPVPDQSDGLPPHPVQESFAVSDVKDVSPETEQPVSGDIDNVQYMNDEEHVSHQPIVHSLSSGDVRPDTGYSMLDARYQNPESRIRYPASSEYPSTETGQTDQDERESLSELRPRPPISPVTSPVYRKDSQEKRLVIGRLRVEVVKPPPVTTQKRAVRINPRRQQPQREIGLSRSKLRFGLGQM
jgi:hypothetical protein